MTRLYANENFPLLVVEKLRRLGHDVLTSQESGQSGQATPDEAVLEFAATQRRAVVTLNRRHFIRLHGQRGDHAGIVVCSFDADSAVMAERIHRSLAGGGDLAGQLIRVNRPGPERRD